MNERADQHGLNPQLQLQPVEESLEDYSFNGTVNQQTRGIAWSMRQLTCRRCGSKYLFLAQ